MSASNWRAGKVTKTHRKKKNMSNSKKKTYLSNFSFSSARFFFCFVDRSSVGKAPSCPNTNLTATPKAFRRERARARSNFAWAKSLERQLSAAKGKGKGKGKKRGASEHVEPKPWSQMSSNDRWYLKHLWDGSLKRRQVEAEARCAPVEAEPFVVQ